MTAPELSPEELLTVIEFGIHEPEASAETVRSGAVRAVGARTGELQACSYPEDSVAADRGTATERGNER